MNLLDITISKLLEMNDPSEYEDFLYLKPKDEFEEKKAKQLMQLPYEKVIKVRQALESISKDGLVNMFEWIFEINEKELMKMKVSQFYPLFNHIIQESTKLIELEQHLSSSDHIWDQAGGKKLAKYGELGVLISLASQFHTTTFEVEKWQYQYVFTLLLFNKDMGDIQENYQRIKSKKP